MGSLIIEPIPCLKDNYAYLLRQGDDPHAYVVDPSEAQPVEAALDRHGLTLRGILATHHHPDHVGGIPALVERYGASVQFVAAHAGDRGRIAGQTVFTDAPVDRYVMTELRVFDQRVVARHIPGHTRAAIAWGLVPAGGGEGEGAVPTDLFTGDTLFAAGCGRLFEGTAEQMHGSLQALTAALPAETRLWFGHEYTAGNLKFAATVDPGNREVAARLAALAPGTMTTPTTVEKERATNPFVRARSVEELAARRKAKDSF